MDSLLNDLPEDIIEISTNTGISIDLITAQALTASKLNSLKDGTYDALWVISGRNTESTELVNAIKTARDNGVGVFLHSENSPYTVLSNQVLIATGIDAVYEGDYQGLGFLSREGFPSDRQGRVHQHAITSGLFQAVDEGATISYFNSASGVLNNPGFQKVLTDTAGHLLSGTLQTRTLTGKEQRLLTHGGWTNLFRAGPNATYGWQKASSPGTPLFYYNAACWIVGL